MTTDDPSGDRRRFFYAEMESDLYDVSIGMTTPQYALMQETILHLAKEHLSPILSRAAQDEVLILDIGSGTGAESIPLMQRFPNLKVIAVDICAPMHERMREKARACGVAPDRIMPITSDIVGDACRPDAVQEAVARSRFSTATTIELVVSALALHHLGSQEKHAVNARVAQFLGVGGVFINGDLFTYHSGAIANSARCFGLEWIRTQFNSPDPEYRDAFDALGDRREELRDKWLNHYEQCNQPDPVHSPDGPPSSQYHSLREAGFTEIECPFRYWELGITWARMPEGLQE